MTSHSSTRVKHKHMPVPERSGLIDWLVYIGAVVEPIMTIPQIYDIWVNGQTATSLLTWGSYLFFAIVWLLYAIKYEIKPLILTEILWVGFQGLVVIGLLVK